MLYQHPQLSSTNFLTYMVLGHGTGVRLLQSFLLQMIASPCQDSILTFELLSTRAMHAVMHSPHALASLQGRLLPECGLQQHGGVPLQKQDDAAQRRLQNIHSSCTMRGWPMPDLLTSTGTCRLVKITCLRIEGQRCLRSHSRRCTGMRPGLSLYCSA